MRGAIISAIVLAITAISAPAIASGSGSGSGGGFGSGGGGSASRQTPEQRLERRGSSQTKKRITCKKCEYHGRLNRQTASEVAKGVIDGKFELSDRNKQAVLYYLRARYGV